MTKIGWTREEIEAVQYDDAEGELLVAQISALLAGKPPQMQAIVLADVVSKLMAGFHPSARKHQRRLWIKMMDELMEVFEAELLSHYGGKWPDRE